MFDIVKFLEMSEEERWKWLYEYFKNKYFKNTKKWPYWYGICEILIKDTYPGRKMILDHLAFRLRDEAVKTNYTNWCKAVDLVLQNSARANWIDYSTSIDWIAAAIAAKEAENVQD